MRVVRLAKRAFANLSGKGPAIHPGRWNSVGNAVVYTSSCGALAVLEVLAHVTREEAIPDDLMLMYIEIPDTLKVERVVSNPADSTTSARIGDNWLKSKDAPILEVPSVVIPRQKNYLINPEHPLAGAISIIESNPFEFDYRILSAVTPP